MRGIELTPEVPVADLVDLAVAAEDAGFDAAFVSSHYNNRDAALALGQVAAATDGVRLGPGVANPYEVHPVTLASQVATLDEISGGRAVLGLGAGDRSTLRQLGVERDRPLRRVLETMQVARRLWDGERVDHDGTFVARGAGLNYGARRVPVYVGAQGPHMLRMSGKYADGVLVNAAHPRDLAWATERVEEGVAERDDDRDPDVVAFASTSVAEDETAAREAARPPVAFIVAGAAEQVLDRHGVDAAAAGHIRDALEAGAFEDAFAAVTPAMIDAFAVAGTPEAVAEKMDRVLARADSVVAGSPLGPDRTDAVRLLAAALDRTARG